MRFFALMLLKRDISKTDHRKNVSYCIGSLISNFFILNGEILTKLIQDFSIPVFLEQFLIPRLQNLRSPTFSISPMPDDLIEKESRQINLSCRALTLHNKVSCQYLKLFSHLPFPRGIISAFGSQAPNVKK